MKLALTRRQLGTGAILAAGAGQIGLSNTPAQEAPVANSNGDLPGLLPDFRIISFYGFPGEPLMGILGEYEAEPLLERLQEQAAEYEALDPARPVKLAFEVIGSVAQSEPGDDGDYLAYISEETLQAWVDFTAERDLLLIIDCQFGRRTAREELETFMPWLAYPHVHIALDPEFHVAEGEVPGQALGTIDASWVTETQNALAGFTRERGLPPKILIVHQFNLYSISNRDQIQPVAGVQFVLEVDGWGAPAAKRETYAVIGGTDAFEFYGFKLWYRQDEPLMSAAEVLALEPPPDIVIYQ